MNKLGYGIGTMVLSTILILIGIKLVTMDIMIGKLVGAIAIIVSFLFMVFCAKDINDND